MEQARYTLDDFLLKAGMIRGLMMKTSRHKYSLNPPEIELLFIIFDLGRHRRAELQTSEILAVYSSHRNTFYSALRNLRIRNLLIIPSKGCYRLTESGKSLIYNYRRDMKAEMIRHS